MKKQELTDALLNEAQRFLALDRAALPAAAKQTYYNAVNALRANGISPATGMLLVAAALSGDGRLTPNEEQMLQDMMGRAPAETVLESLAAMTSDAYRAAGQLKALSDADLQPVISLVACFLAADGDVNRDELASAADILS